MDVETDRPHLVTPTLELKTIRIYAEILKKTTLTFELDENESSAPPGRGLRGGGGNWNWNWNWN